MEIFSKSHDVFALPGDWTAIATNAGERYLPLINTYSAAMHLGHMASYREALRYSYGRRVLDIGCGVGYGAFFLASYGAKQVIGLDLSPQTLAYASRVYSHPNLMYLQANGLQLPFIDGYFDFVFSSQVIEHVPSVEQFMSEIRRVLSPTGFCLITTPNKQLFTPFDNGSDNPHHLNEMDLATYRSKAGTVFPQTQFYGIPQKCLWLPEGQTQPIGKLNSEIQLHDYQVQKDNLENCENLLCFGHKEAKGDFSVSLPDKLKGVADQLAPFFWDASNSAWVVMGIHPDNKAPLLTTASDSFKFSQPFESPYPHLYRVELNLGTPSKYPLIVSLYRSSKTQKTRLAKKILQPGEIRMTLQFASQADSQSQSYVLRIHPRLNLPKLVYFILAWVKRGLNQTAQFEAPIPEAIQNTYTLHTFHDYLPNPD